MKETHLTNLYLYKIINRVTISVFLVFLLTITILLYFFLDKPKTMAEEVLYQEEYLTAYKSSSIMLFSFINVLIITYFIGLEVSGEYISFDAFFLPNISRFKLFMVKTRAQTLLLLWLVLFEYIMAELMPMMFYETYVITFKTLDDLLSLLLYTLYFLCLGKLMLQLIPHIIGSFVFFLSFFIGKLAADLAEESAKIVNIVIPQLDIKNGFYHLYYGVELLILEGALFFILTYLFYKKRFIIY